MTPFNFGPIARTEAGGTKDTINLASFPIHVMLNALVGATSVEEFIAWLWHDLYKPIFYWVRKDKLSWYHIPGMGAFSDAEKKFAQRTNIREGLVRTHHFKDRPPHFALDESDFISDQGDQFNLGAAVNYIQLSLAAEPALPTLLTRSVIADAFIEVVTKDVAKALNKAFIDSCRTPIEQVRFEFETASNITFSSPPNDDEIWNKVGKHFDVCLDEDDNTVIMRHLTPIDDPKHESFKTVFTADLTGNSLSPDEMLKNIVSLAELLVLYQDSRTVIIAVPQTQLYSSALSTKIQKIQKATLDISRNRLEQDFKVLTKKNNVDYLKAAFDSQIHIREVPGRLPKRPKSKKGKKDNFRPLNDVVQHPTEMLTEARNSPNGKLCCITGTWFKANLPASALSSKSLFQKTFVDTEFVGIVEDSNQKRYISPLAYLYVINSSGAKKGKETRKAFRGSFAYLAPASHFAADDQKLKALEQPPLDIGGRFCNQLNRVTVTTQEFTLFQQISRRVVARLWQHILPDEPLPLPYLGAIVLTHESKERVRNLLPHLELIFSEVTLKAYPFESKVHPAIEVALETSVKDARHAGKHTLLKTTPSIITLDPQSVVQILIDDNVQVSLTKEFFKQANLLAGLTNGLTRQKKKESQREQWLKLVVSSNDPVTAAFESSQATIDTQKLPKTLSLEAAAFKDAEDFWNKHINSWEEYEHLKQNATNALEEFPALLLLMRVLQKQRQTSQKQVKVEQNETDSLQQLNLFTFPKLDEN